MPEDEKALRMIALQLELLRSEDLPPLAYGGAWTAACMGPLMGRPAVAQMVLESGVFELAVSHLRTIGSPAEYLVRCPSECCRCVKDAAACY